MFFHGSIRTHSVECDLSVFDVTATFIVSSQHATQHDKVSTSTKGLGHISWTGTSTIGDDMTTHAVCRISTLDDGRQLRVANTGLYASGAHTAGTYAYFDYVCPTQYQLLCHVGSDHVAGDDHMLGKGLSHQFNKITEMLTIAVGHIYADELDLWLCFEYHLQFGKFYFTGTGTHSQAIGINLTAFTIPISHGVIFHHARKHFMLGQAAGHGPCAHSIHVGRHDGHS